MFNKHNHNRISKCLIIALSAILCVATEGCGMVERGKDYVENKAEELLLGSDADQQMLISLAEGSFEGMCEAIESGADLDTLRDSRYSNPLLYLLAAEEKAFISIDGYGNLTDMNYAKYLLEHGADPNWADNKGHTLIMHCCGYSGIGYPGGMPLMELLISYGADVNAVDKSGYTALDYRVNDLEAATILLNGGAVVTEKTIERAFHVLQNSSHVEAALAPKLILDAYIKQGNTPNLPTVVLSAAQGDSAAVLSALKGGVPEEYQSVMGQLIVAFCNTDAVEAAREQGLTPDNIDGALGLSRYLDLAIQAEQAETVLLFIEPDTLFDTLNLSVSCGKAEIVQMLLEQGALDGFVPTDAQAGFPWEVFDNLLSSAAATGDVEMVRLLIDYGYPTNELSLWQALNSAIYADSIDVVKYLCEEQDASTTYVYEDNDSPLETAAMRGSLEIAKYLVSRGVSVPQEANALPNAVVKGHRDMVQYLLEQGADPNGADTGEDDSASGEALSQAIQTGRLDLVQLLVDAGADVNGKWGDTPLLCVAARGESVGIVQYLMDHGADVNAADADGKTPLDWASLEKIATAIKGER